FGVLLVDAGPTTTRVLMERMRVAVRQSAVETPAGRVDVRVSLGVAVFEPGDEPRSPLELLDLADRALRRAKRQGRDRACYLDVRSARRAAG
ncbi:MAG: diguanylate cyclase, partial [Myxococcota bacterium]|nr:diguanylate cyclase [Myxococcota bacterium]